MSEAKSKIRTREVVTTEKPGRVIDQRRITPTPREGGSVVLPRPGGAGSRTATAKRGADISK